MSSLDPKPVIVDVDITRVLRILDDIRAVLPPEDHDCLVSIVDTLHEVIKAMRERGSTIRRLRRLFRISSSEKTANVLRRMPTEARGEDEQATPDSDAPEATSAGPDQQATPDSDARKASSAGPDDQATPDSDSGAKAESTGTEPESPTEKPKRKGHGRIPCSAYKNVCVTAVGHATLHVGDTCPDCTHGTLYRYQPVRILRLVGQAPIAAQCWDCEQFRCSGCGKVHTACAPAEARGPKYTDGAVAMLALLRYRAGLPLYRLDKLQCSMGTPLPASTQWEVVRDRLVAVEPVYEELFGRAAEGRILHTDDTNMPVLEFMGKRREALLAAGELDAPERTGLFTTGVVSVVDQRLIALFFTGRKHAGENLDDLLDDRDPEMEPPIHMSDGLNRNSPKDHLVVKAACLAHGRRHVIDEVSNFPDECRHVLEELGKAFENEVACKKLGLTGDERMRFHQEHSGDVMTNLQAWMNAQLDEKKIEPNSGLGTAFRYLLKRWGELTLFLRVPDAPLENNRCERVLKMAIRHRNNSLFYRSLRGAHVGDVYMSLIHTAELNDENPLEYLLALFAHPADVAANPSAWLPWTFRATLAERVGAAA